MWCVVPLVVGVVVMVFLWVWAMIDRMDRPCRPPARVIVVCYVFGGIILALGHTFVPPDEYDMFALSPAVFGTIALLTAIEYCRNDGEWPTRGDWFIGVAAACAMAVPVACESYMRPLLEPGWMMRAWVGVTAMLLVFLHCTEW